MSTATHPRRSPLGLFPGKPALVRRFVEYHQRRRPRQLAEGDINRFLTHLAVKSHVAASTQNQALSALLFLYEHVLEQPLDRIEASFAPAVPSGWRLP